MNEVKVLRFSWPTVVRRFQASFESVFSSNKKAHFDCLPQAYKVIDGARGRWCNLLLLDAVIYYLTATDFIFVSRRAFNQQKVLYDAVMDELEAMDKHMYSDVLSGRVSLTESNIAVCELDYPWDNIRDLKSFLLQDPPAKSKYRFQHIIDLLCDNSPLSKSELRSVIISAMCKATQLVEEHDKQIALGNCPKTTVKQENFKLTCFYKQCAALSGKATTKPRSKSVYDRSSYSQRLYSADSDDEYEEEEYPRKRRYSADQYPTRTNVDSWWLRGSHSMSTRQQKIVHCPDDEGTLNDDFGLFPLDALQSRSMSHSTIIPVAPMHCAEGSSSSSGIDGTSSVATGSEYNSLFAVAQDDADMADCLATFLRSDSLDSMNLNLFDDSLDEFPSLK